MSFIDSIKAKFKKNNNSYYKIYDAYTMLTIYYEIKFDKEGNPLSCDIVSDIKDNSNIIDYEKANYFIKNIIDFTMENLGRSVVTNENYFEIGNLYRMKYIDKESLVKETYDKYLEVMKKVKDKCIRHNVYYTEDKNLVFLNIISRINEYKKSEDEKRLTSKELITDRIKLSTKRELMDEAVKEEISSGNFNSKQFMYEKIHLTAYCSSYIKYFPMLLNILDKKIIAKDDRLTLARYLEFFNVLPKIVETLDYLEECYDKVETAKLHKNYNKFKSNNKFVNEINNLLSKVDSEEDLYIHVTKDLDSAKSILEHGLYTTGDISSFGEPYDNIDQIFKYEYGSATNAYSECVVIFRMPKGSIEPMKISEEEANKALTFIETRRKVIIKPTNKVPTSDILGIVDKKRMNIIPNRDFKVMVENRFPVK